MHDNNTAPALAVEFTEENYDPRCPCMLVLDVSISMHGDPIQQLNEGLRQFQQELNQDALASRRVEVGLITFGGSAQVVQEFTAAGSFSAPVLSAGGGTPMGAALTLALERLRARKKELKASGIPYYQPWLWLITDGVPTDAWEAAAAAVQAEGSQDKGVNVFCVGVEGADMGTLAQIAPPKRPPLKLKGLQFAEMFAWVSQSLAQVSSSNPGEKVQMQNPTSAGGWGEFSA